jgi:hypothetical protein
MLREKLTKNELFRKIPSVLLQLGCLLLPHLFIFGALMDKLLNWQRNHEHRTEI